METFLAYWEHIPSTHRILILISGLIFFWLIEGAYPFFKFSFKRYKHAGINLVFLSTSLLLNLVFGITAIKICSLVMKYEIGLFNFIEMPIWVRILLALFFMDLFGQYIPHLLMHKIKWMWKFHIVHHSDTKVDVTTGTRHHPGEWIFRESFTIIGIVILGMPVGLYFLYRSTAGLFAHLTHANIKLPRLIDQPLSWIFVTPNLHKIHHHFERPYTDRNYANIFSFWDRLFGTFQYEHPLKLKYGLDVLDDKTDENLNFQFRIPFNKNIKTDY